MGADDEIRVIKENTFPVKLQVQIAALGQDGINRVASHNHPAIRGVRWLVSLQNPHNTVVIPDELAKRDDFDIIVHHDVGVSKNRNHALEYPCDSELVLLSDDDVSYTEQSILDLIQAFDRNPDADIICGRYTIDGKSVKNYGDRQFSLDKPPFGWYPSLIEIAFRRRSLGTTRFNENIGPGSGKLIAGEDTIWFFDMMNKKVKGLGLPIVICEHDGESMGQRLKTHPDFLKAHGACMTHIKPLTWFPRLILHAWRAPMPFFRCLRHTLRGAVYAYTHRTFVPVRRK